MLKLIALSLSTLLFVQTVFGSPLVFKSKVEVKTQDITELCIFDSSKYKQIRVAVKFESAESSIGEITLYSVENGEEVFLANNSYNFLIETPPTKIKVKTKGVGTYKIFIWAD